LINIKTANRTCALNEQASLDYCTGTGARTPLTSPLVQTVRGLLPVED